MMKVLVVDDEKLVRKGIVTVLPWNKYEMEVVGEAQNGKAAMEFMSANPVDLLVTDLLMPGLSGINFIAQVTDCFPETMIVILTFLQDFDIVQQALRIGVIDYITKAQVERENADEILERISSRIQKEKKARSGEAKLFQHLSGSRAVAVYFSDGRCEAGRFQGIPGVESVLSLGGRYLLLPMQASQLDETINRVLERLDEGSGEAALVVEGAESDSPHSIVGALDQYVARVLFYEYRADGGPYRVNLSDIENLPQIPSENDLKEIASQYLSMKWVADGAEYERLEHELRRLSADAEALQRVFYSAFCEWMGYLNQATASYFDEVCSFRYWQQWKQWLDGYRARLAERLRHNRFSPEIIDSINRAILFLQAHYTEDINLEDVLCEVSMSKSYFSECFKAVTCKSFSEYLRDLRLERAKKLLRQTDKPIYWVSENCGYGNEKYFSRIFKEATGILPRDYRSNNL